MVDTVPIPVKNAAQHMPAIVMEIVHGEMEAALIKVCIGVILLLFFLLLKF